MHLEGDPVAFAETYVRYLSQGHCFLPGAEEALRTLQKSYRLFLATNGFPQVQYGRLDSAGIRDCFEKIFIRKKQITGQLLFLYELRRRTENERQNYHRLGQRYLAGTGKGIEYNSSSAQSEIW
jgi:hypothetical protein